MHGSVSIRRSSVPPGTPTTHHFPPMAVDSLHHHHANNHNRHHHMARIKAGVARTSSSSASSSSSAGKERLSARVSLEHRASSDSSSGVNDRVSPGGALDHRSSLPSSSSSTGSVTGTNNERLTPKRFLEKYSLPRVVRVVAEPGTDRRLSGPLAEPLLLYRQYSACKVAARSLRRDGKQVGAEVGPPLVIPDSYQGWFSLVRERSLQTRAKVYTAVQQLVSGRVAMFLTKNPLTGFKLVASNECEGDGAGRRLQYARTSVRGGQVLRLLAVFEDNETGRASTRSTTSSSSWCSANRSGAQRPAQRFALLSRRSGSSQPQQYAQCLTARSESVFVPVNTAGTFYAVVTEESTDQDLSSVYQLPQLLRLTADPLPVKVQLVCGPVQNPLPTGFTGLLVLEDLQQEDVILACTLPRSWALPPPPPPSGPGPISARESSPGPPSKDTSAIASHTSPAVSSSSSSQTSPVTSDKPVFLEMDADSKFLLTRPLSSRDAEARFFKTPLIRRVLSYCRERASVWSSQIKVTHHVFPSADAATASAATTAAVVLAASSSRSTSEQRAGTRPTPRAKSHERSSVSSGGTKKSQSFRYASPAIMMSTVGSSTSSSSGGGNGSVKTGKESGGKVAGGTARGTHHLLQQLQNLPAALHGLKNILHRTSSVTPSDDDVPLSVVFPELFGHAITNTEENGASPISVTRPHLRFYADDLPYGKVADAIVPDSANDYSRHRMHDRRSLYPNQEDEDDDENIYAEICECPRGAVVSGARVILTTTSSEERRGYFTFASATSKDQYCYLHTGGSDGTFSGTMSSSNPSNPEEDIYDTVC